MSCLVECTHTMTSISKGGEHVASPLQNKAFIIVHFDGSKGFVHFHRAGKASPTLNLASCRISRISNNYS